MKKISYIALLAVVIWLMAAYPRTMLNPGDLTVSHQNISSDCFACHKPFWGISNDKCIACHKLSEIGLKGSNNNSGTPIKKILFHQSLTDNKCTACHTDHNGLKPVNSISNFSHELLTTSTVNNCSGCHVIPADNKHSKYKPVCKSCHTTNKWSNSENFRHEYILEEEVNNCSSCHGNPGDEFHSAFTENCGECHSTQKWKPSTFDHSNKFVLDKDHNAKCITCHAENNYKKYTCYGCHEHSPEKIRREHLEENINNFEDCVSCHKSGDEDDLQNMDNNENNRKENDKEHDDDDDDDD